MDMDLDYFVISLKKPSGAPPRAGGIEGAIIASRIPTTWSDETLIPGGALEMAQEQEPITPDSLTLESTQLTQRQVQDAARDPDTMVAPVMPVELIAPLTAMEGAAAEEAALAAAAGAGTSWGITQVGADTSTMTGEGVIVAVLDTGIDAGHAAFQGMNIIAQNFTSNDPTDTMDRHGHGTHCAGTVFGRDVDGVRIGVARGVKTAVIGKVLDDAGRGTTTAVLKALHWAGSQKANVVSMSLGFDFPGMQKLLVASGRPPELATSMALKAYRENLKMFDTLFSFLMLENSESPGMVVVAASGNESQRLKNANFVIDASMPAAASADVISVGAMAQAAALFDIAPFSNINPVLCAPGVGIISAKPQGGLKSMNGTSMACPHVAGLAALWWEWTQKNIGQVKAGAVRARVIASAQANSFVPTVSFADRGNGLAKAPS